MKTHQQQRRELSGLKGKRALVTGATGFIGGRLVEKLVLEHGVEVRAFVSSFTNCSRLSRFEVEFFQGDLLEPLDVTKAAADCDFIFHCAYGSRGTNEMRRRVNVEGTKNIMEAALIHRTSRVVYTSTLMVYGTPQDGDLNEDAPRQYAGGVYADSKLDAENVAFEYAQKHGVPVSILQPTAVYGPFAPVWTTNVLEKLRTGQVVLVDGGEGLCNAVYIDDLVDAMLLAAVREEAVGEAFLISGERPISWREFYGRFEQMLGEKSTVAMSAAEAEALARAAKGKTSVLREMKTLLLDNKEARKRLRRTAEVATLLKFGRQLLPSGLKRRFGKERQAGVKWLKPSTEEQKPVHAVTLPQVQFYRAKPRVRIDKAKRLLGFEPAFDFESGMELTEQWARWANLLNEPEASRKASA